MSWVYDYQVTASDTDAGGIVYYVNYLKIMERAREAVLAASGAGAEALALLPAPCALHVASCEIKYVASAKLGDVVQVHTALQSQSAAQCVLSQTVCVAGRALVQASIVLVAVTLPERAPCQLPDSVRAGFSALAAWAVK